ncbi:consensus disorder prediction [Desulfoluna spongiiphila]|nr:consensus disorder prediction [Desulfoluna spongiiphila]
MQADVQNKTRSTSPAPQHAKPPAPRVHALLGLPDPTLPGTEGHVATPPGAFRYAADLETPRWPESELSAPFQDLTDTCRHLPTEIPAGKPGVLKQEGTSPFLEKSAPPLGLKSVGTEAPRHLDRIPPGASGDTTRSDAPEHHPGIEGDDTPPAPDGPHWKTASSPHERASADKFSMPCPDTVTLSDHGQEPPRTESEQSPRPAEDLPEAMPQPERKRATNNRTTQATESTSSATDNGHLPWPGDRSPKQGKSVPMRKKKTDDGPQGPVPSPRPSPQMAPGTNAAGTPKGLSCPSGHGEGGELSPHPPSPVPATTLEDEDPMARLRQLLPGLTSARPEAPEPESVAPSPHGPEPVPEPPATPQPVTQIVMVQPPAARQGPGRAAPWHRSHGARRALLKLIR